MAVGAPAIRMARRSDAEAVGAIYGPVVANTAASFELEPPSPQEVERRIAKTLDVFPWLVAEHDGRVIGYAYASPHRARPAYAWSVESSVFVAQGERGTGHGSALMRALLEILALQGFLRCFAGVTLPNPASVRLHLALGYEPVGVFGNVGFKGGRWHDVAWYQIDLAEPPSGAPAPPLPLGGCGEGPAAWEGVRLEELRSRLRAFAPRPHRHG